MLLRVSSYESPPPPLPPPVDDTANNELIRFPVSFISLVISAFEWKPNTSGGDINGKFSLI